jgi:hypothetical protein
MRIPEEIVEKYREMWTSNIDRYAIVQVVPDETDECLLFDFTHRAYVVVEEEEDVVRLLLDNMRRAGVRTISPDEVSQS